MFAGFGLPKDTASYSDRLNDMNVTDIVFGLNGDDYEEEVQRGRRVKRLGDSDFHLFHSPERIVTVCREVAAAGISPHLMTWLHPDEPWMEAVRDYLYPIAAEARAVSVLLDLERYWVKPKASPTRFKSSDFQTTIPSSFQRILVSGRAPKLGITSYALMPARVKPVMPYVSYGIPQAYSVYNSVKDYTKDGGYRPGKTQRLANTWLRHTNRVVMGLANYWQGHPTGPTGVEALRLALGETIALGYREVAYWSLPWVKGEIVAFTRSILNTAGGLPTLPSRRNTAVSAATRPDFQRAAERAAPTAAEIAAEQFAKDGAVHGRFLVEKTNNNGLLYNFQVGKWNDEA
jgi:hypothetical protein